MTLRNYGSRAEILLRLAPWADLELIRGKLAERLLKICDAPDYFTEAQKKQIVDFSEGKGHITRSSLRSKRAVELTLAELYPNQQARDVKFRDATREFYYYFFSSNEYLGIRP